MRHFYKIRTQFAVAICSLILIGLSMNAKGQLPFSDGFESGNFTSGGWITTGNSQISTQSPFEGSYCVKGPGTYNIEKTFSSITDNIVTIEFAMKASQTGSNCVSFAAKDQSDNYSASVFFRHTGYIVAYDGFGYNQQIDLMAYNADTWYEMKIVLNMSTKKYDVFIDGQLKADDFDFYNSGFTTPIKFSWGSGETWGTGWVDYVRISGQGSQNYLPFQDCFESGNFTSGGWITTGNSQISTQSPFEGSYCVKGPGTYNIEKTFSSITDNIVTIEFAMKASQTGSNCVSFAAKDQSDNYSASVFFRHTGYIVAYDGFGYNQQIDLMAYNADTWYEMKIVLNMSTKKYDVFIDGQLKADDFDFYNSGFTTPIKFSWGSGETWGTGWVDCVDIYPGNVGINNAINKSTTFKVFPNPVHNLLNITSNLSEIFQINIFNSIGQQVHSQFACNDIEVRMNGFSKGIYFIEIKGKNGNILFSEKLIKE